MSWWGESSLMPPSTTSAPPAPTSRLQRESPVSDGGPLHARGITRQGGAIGRGVDADARHSKIEPKMAMACQPHRAFLHRRLSRPADQLLALRCSCLYFVCILSISIPMLGRVCSCHLRLSCLPLYSRPKLGVLHCSDEHQVAPRCRRGCTPCGCHW